MAVPTISVSLLAFFRGIVRGYFRRHFHGVRISGAERFVHDGSSLILYANHSSWWDPMVSILLASKLMRNRRHYAPMDADALERYRLLKHLGIFPVEMKTRRGAVQFMRVGEEILQAGGVLWITPQGRFADARERPLDFKPGLAALASRTAQRMGSCTILPLAIEYPFWNERLPETLLHFGEPVRLSAHCDPDEVQERLAAALEQAMDELKALALLRDPAKFEVLHGGRAGSGGFYAIGQRIRALLSRRAYQPEHTQMVKTDASARPVGE
jgi:1-acyl-sn-glycerol-3-phosphate acyltransferase